MNRTIPLYIPLLISIFLISIFPVFSQNECLETNPTERFYKDLEITSGKKSLKETKSKFLAIEGPQSRATVKTSWQCNGKLRFRYRGHSSSDKPLGSGIVRRQIGMKLFSGDPCNLLYVMWEVEPIERVSVFMKHNSGMSTSDECKNNGYTRLESDSPPVNFPPKNSAKDQKTHRLAASLIPFDNQDGTKGNDFELVVCADYEEVFRKRLIDLPSEISGPSGIRTDNGSFIFRFFAD